MRTAAIPAITPANIVDQWGTFITRLRPLPEAALEALKSLIFWRYLHGAAPDINSSLWWMASLIFSEASGEPEQGKLAVGWVVMNREAVQRWTGFRNFGINVQDVIARGTDFAGYNNDAWNLAMEFYENPTIHDASTVRRNLGRARSRINAERRDAERQALLLSLQAAETTMNRRGNDPTVGGFDGIGATFFKPSYDETVEGSAKQAADDLARNDRKGRIGNHEFWDRSVEWYWCDWRARRLPPGVALPEVCFPILPKRRPDNVRFLPEADIAPGVREMNLRNRPRR